ncbi:hypothetical protein D6T63_17590 [Arthrobacter cheniae]|uniref:Uncharacterized protein n=1 Tax=Arthrobacter cheniae TaxID=1258888 RepID=A0A3A5M9B0_9MICC|nr:hypothetical protein [Arthrobacter cheniae]RJT75634.1 hypothetical protein D6T63_17590 [Arthrobacter cheniae]
MSFDLTLCPVHALSVLPSGTTVGGIEIGDVGAIPAATKLRLREVMELQQALHNAHPPAHTDRLTLIGNLIGRPLASFSEVRRYELRPLLRSLIVLSAKNDS